jgi:hypothetical protein
MRRYRALCLLGLTALAVFAFAGVAQAGGKSHFIKLYKVEVHVDLEGDSTHAHAFCNPGDYAIDGMWRIDQVDQDNDFDFGGKDPLTSVRVIKSYGDGTISTSPPFGNAPSNDPAKWHFVFEKDTPGDAQVKLFAVCLSNKTAPDGHQHAFTLGNQTASAMSPLGSTWGATTPSCPAGQISVAPGFIHDPGTDYRLVSRLLSPGHNAWNLQFFPGSPPGPGGGVFARCLTLKSSVVNSHTHSIIKKYVTSTSPIPAKSTTEVQQSCGELYKAALGTFDLGPGYQAYFLGMDPRPKIRAFKFYNSDPFNPVNVTVGALCFQDRTT